MWGSMNEAPGAGKHTTTAGHSEGPLRPNSSCHDIRELQTFASVERMHGAATPRAAPSRLWCSSHTIPPFLCLHNLLLLWDRNFSGQQFPVLLPPMLNCPHSPPLHCLPPPLPFPHFPAPWDLHVSAHHAVRLECWTECQNRSNNNSDACAYFYLWYSMSFSNSGPGLLSWYI